MRISSSSAIVITDCHRDRMRSMMSPESAAAASSRHQKISSERWPGKVELENVMRWKVLWHVRSRDAAGIELIDGTFAAEETGRIRTQRKIRRHGTDRRAIANPKPKAWTP